MCNSEEEAIDTSVDCQQNATGRNCPRNGKTTRGKNRHLSLGISRLVPGTPHHKANTEAHHLKDRQTVLSETVFGPFPISGRSEPKASMKLPLGGGTCTRERTLQKIAGLLGWSILQGAQNYLPPPPESKIELWITNSTIDIQI